VSASHWTIGQVAVTWLLCYIVGAGNFAHCIATSGEIITASMRGAVTYGAYFQWLLFATLGNIVGGVTIVSVLNWGQVHAGESH
jgi:formate/nitrite transporter FocA (FNT family)